MRSAIDALNIRADPCAGSYVSCYACGNSKLQSFYKISSIPTHSCVILRDRSAAISFPRGDLDLSFCAQCGFIQNNLFNSNLQDFASDYDDSQACSQNFSSFLNSLVVEQIGKHRLDGKTVLEIGAGQGDFISLLCESARCRGIAIGPSCRPNRFHGEVTERISVIQDRFGAGYAQLKVDHVVCRHTLEHIQDVRAFVHALYLLALNRPGLTIMFEVPDTERILREAAFWDVYYEHCSYFTSDSLATLFRRTGFEVTEVREAYDGQYLLLEAVLALGNPSDSTGSNGVQKTAALIDHFSRTVSDRMASLASDVRGWAKAGKRVVVWGASSKAVAYLNTLGLDGEVAGVVDINPTKRGGFLAGTGHVIYGVDDLVEVRPDVAVLTNPIYTEEIRVALAQRDLAPQLVPL